jgi:hypothetical protein
MDGALQMPGDRLWPGVQALPCPARALRNLMIRSAVSALIAVGEVRGRRGGGSNAASPSAR